MGSDDRGPTKCSTGGDLCRGMTVLLKGASARGIGISLEQTMDLKSGEFGHAVIYRFPRKIDGYTHTALTFCPVCGERLVPDAKIASSAPPPKTKESR